MASSLKHNTLYNLAGAVIPTIAAILTIPAYLREIGEARYGVLSLIWLIFGYFGLFDFGLSRATAHRLSALRTNNKQERATVFYSAVCLNSILGLSVAGLFYLVAIPILNLTMGNNTSMHGEILEALPWIAGFFPIALLNGVLVGCMEAHERFLQLNIQQVVGAILLQCLPLAFVYWLGASLEYAVLGAIAARTFAIAWLALDCFGWAFSAGPFRIDKAHIKELLRYGGWITISNSISPILTSVDQFIIGLMLGASAVAHYSVPFSMANKLLILPAALTRALFPRLSSMEPKHAEELSHKSLNILSFTMIAMCVPAILLANNGLKLWIGDDFAHAAHLAAELLLVGTWINGLAFVPFTFLQGQNRPDIIAKIHAIEVIPFVLLLSLFIALFGLAGAAAAWCLRVLFDGALMFYYARFEIRALRDLGAPCLAILVGLSVAEFVEPGMISSIVWSAAIVSCLFAWTLKHDKVLLTFLKTSVAGLLK